MPPKHMTAVPFPHHELCSAPGWAPLFPPTSHPACHPHCFSCFITLFFFDPFHVSISSHQVSCSLHTISLCPSQDLVCVCVSGTIVTSKDWMEWRSTKGKITVSQRLANGMIWENSTDCVCCQAWGLGHGLHEFQLPQWFWINWLLPQFPHLQNEEINSSYIMIEKKMEKNGVQTSIEIDKKRDSGN